MATKYTFDIKLFTTAYVLADSEQEARRILSDFAGFDDVGRVNPKLYIGSAEQDGEADLVDEEEDATELVPASWLEVAP